MVRKASSAEGSGEAGGYGGWTAKQWRSWRKHHRPGQRDRESLRRPLVERTKASGSMGVHTRKCLCSELGAGEGEDAADVGACGANLFHGRSGRGCFSCQSLCPFFLVFPALLAGRRFAVRTGSCRSGCRTAELSSGSRICSGIRPGRLWRRRCRRPRASSASRRALSRLWTSRWFSCRQQEISANAEKPERRSRDAQDSLAHWQRVQKVPWSEVCVPRFVFVRAKESVRRMKARWAKCRSGWICRPAIRQPSCTTSAACFVEIVAARACDETRRICLWQ